MENKGLKQKTEHMFSNTDLRKILVPVAIEQFLTSMMGTADTMMVSNVGAAAISAASLVDSLNVLVIQAFSALSAGGTIICAHYIGGKNREQANKIGRTGAFYSDTAFNDPDAYMSCRE